MVELCDGGVVWALEEEVRGCLRTWMREREGCKQTYREGCVCKGEEHCHIEEEETHSFVPGE